MWFRQTSKFALLIATTLMIASSSTAYGGSNEGFSVGVIPREITNVQVGGSVAFAIGVDNITTISGALVKVKYDPSLFAPATFVEGALLTGALGSQFFGLVVSTDTDGLSIVEAGLTLFTGPVEASGGRLGIMTFDVVAEVPIDGTSISLVEVTLNGTDSEDTDTITYGAGEFDIDVVRRFPNKLFDLSIVRKFNGANFT